MGETPVFTIARCHAERNSNSQTSKNLIVDLVSQVHVRNRRFRRTTVFAFTIVTRIFEIQAHADHAALDVRARVQGHRSGVVVGTRDVRSVHTDTSVGAA